MSSLAMTLGLTSNGLQQPPSHGAHYLIFHFIWAYMILSSRAWKLYYKLDHNVSPREDLTKYGPAAVQKGKITQSTLDQMKRVESCHANSVEHFPVFAAAVIFAHVAGLETTYINRLGLYYTIARTLYSLQYILTRNPTLSWARGIWWWSSNIICLRAFWSAGRAFNASRV